MKTRENLIAIEYDAILKMVEIGKLIPIVKLDSQSTKSMNDKMATNGYFRIADAPNLVWMHVQHGYGIITNEYVVNDDGISVNLIDSLSRHYWYVEKKTSTVRCGNLGCMPIWRYIGSIIHQDGIDNRMPKWLETHHKWWKWCNTQETLTYVCKKKHDYFHNYINSRRSHRKGVTISTMTEFDAWMTIIAGQVNYWKLQEM